MVWKPHVTVAAVIEQDQRFLLVEEHTTNGIEFNQPAGHLEENETLLAAVKREVLEETAWQFEPQRVVSVQLWRKDAHSTTFLRICFSGRCHSYNPALPLDEGIIAAHWLTLAEIEAHQQRLRSPLVMGCIQQYLDGHRYPLSLIKSLMAGVHE